MMADQPDCPVLSEGCRRLKGRAPLATAPMRRQRMQPEPSSAPPARGYFGVGAERISKALNLGNLMRSAHGFGASFTFTIGADYQPQEARADTSKGAQHLPHYNWASPS